MFIRMVLIAAALGLAFIAGLDWRGLETRAAEDAALSFSFTALGAVIFGGLAAIMPDAGSDG